MITMDFAGYLHQARPYTTTTTTTTTTTLLQPQWTQLIRSPSPGLLSPNRGLTGNRTTLTKVEVPASTTVLYPTVLQVLTPGYEGYAEPFGNVQATIYTQNGRLALPEVTTGLVSWESMTPSDSLDYVSSTTTATAALSSGDNTPRPILASLPSLSSVGSRSSSFEVASPRPWLQDLCPPPAPMVHVTVVSRASSEPTPVTSPTRLQAREAVLSELEDSPKGIAVLSVHPDPSPSQAATSSATDVASSSRAPSSSSSSLSTPQASTLLPAPPETPTESPTGTDAPPAISPHSHHHHSHHKGARHSPQPPPKKRNTSPPPVCVTAIPTHTHSPPPPHPSPTGPPSPSPTTPPNHGGTPHANPPVRRWVDGRVPLPSPANHVVIPPLPMPPDAAAHPAFSPAARSAWPTPPGATAPGWPVPRPFLQAGGGAAGANGSPTADALRPLPLAHSLPQPPSSTAASSQTVPPPANSSPLASDSPDSSPRADGSRPPLSSRRRLSVQFRGDTPMDRPVTPLKHPRLLGLREGRSGSGRNSPLNTPTSPGPNGHDSRRPLPHPDTRPPLAPLTPLLPGSARGRGLSPHLRMRYPSDALNDDDRAQLQRDSTQSALLFKGREQHQASSKRVLGLQDFELIRVIGQGQFGKVWKVRHNEEVYAMKAIRKEFFDKKGMFGLLKTERALLASIQHPFLTSLKYAFQTPQRAFLVMDYVSGGEMGYHLNRDPRQFWEEDRVKLYTAQLVLALEYLHHLGVLHRDLKIDNVLFDEQGHAVLIDLGLAKKLRPGEMEPGSQAYLGVCNLYFSPEMLRGEDFGYESDWWALGVLVYGLLMGSVPFPAPNLLAMQQMIMSEQEVEIPEARQLSYPCSHFLRSMLAKKKAKRLKKAKDIKSHPWFSDLDWDKVYRRKVPMPWIPPEEDEEDELSNPAMSYCMPPSRDLDLHNFSFVWTPRRDSPSPCQSPR